MTTPGPMIASGRSADIYEFGAGRVLRRRRSGPIPAAETAVMRAVEAEGFPVPKVHAVDGTDMTMDRIDGPDMLTRLTKRPWQAHKVGTMLAKLHRELAAIPVGDTELQPMFGDAESFVHGDFHPGNVLIASDGPTVIDWEGAGVGPKDADTAITWMLLETADPDDVPALIRPLVKRIRQVLVRAFLAGVTKPRPETIAAACEMRLGDSNMRPHELAQIRAFADRHSL